jgi:hypothetical protein
MMSGVENADLLKRGDAVVNPSDGCVKAVKEIVDLWFRSHKTTCASGI